MTCSFRRVTTTFAGIGALSAPPWCVLSMCNTTHVKTMSLTTFSLCSMVHSSTVKLDTKYPKRVLHLPPASGDPVVSNSFSLCKLSSAVGFYHPGHQGKGAVTQQEIVQIWPCLSVVQVAEAPRCHLRSSPSNHFG